MACGRMADHQGHTPSHISNPHQTTGEGFGMPLAEAMSCEVPVVAVDYTTTKELLIDEVKDSKDDAIDILQKPQSLIKFVEEMVYLKNISKRK